MVLTPCKLGAKKGAFFLEICIATFDNFAIYFLGFMGPSLLHNHVMRNRSQVGPLVPMVI